jgi:serine/threonine protein kinase
MMSTSTILPNRDEPTAVLRSPALVTQTFDGFPARLPTLSGPEHTLPFGTPVSQITVPGYEVIRELGRGGMGVVYLARHIALDRLVALKMVIARQYAGREEQARFRQEVEAVAKLNHPNITQVFEVGQHDGFSYAAFEYVSGGTLLQWQDNQPIPARDAARLVTRLARAIQHAHDHGIIHRDLKPANILMARPETSPRVADSVPSLIPGGSSSTRMVPIEVIPKITDFGLAKKIDQQSDITATGMACGTPNYMAPEQIRGKQGLITPATDVYGLGAILYELIAGRPPFRGETPMATMQSVLHDPAPSVAKSMPGTPRDLVVIVSKCLEKDPARRYDTANDVADDLERFLENRPIQARGVSRVERARRWVQRNPYPTALMASLLAGLMAMGALAVNFRQSAGREREYRRQLSLALDHETQARTDAIAALARAESAERDAQARRSEAVQAQTVAEAARQETQAALTTAESLRKIAEIDRDKSTTSLSASLMLVDNFLKPIASDLAFREDEQLPLRRWLLSQTYRSLESMWTQNSTNLEIRHRMHRVENFFGQFSQGIGDAEIAWQHFFMAQAGMHALVVQQPDRVEWQLDAAQASLDLVAATVSQKSLVRMPCKKYLDDARVIIDARMARVRNADERLTLERMNVQESILRCFDAKVNSPRDYCDAVKRAWGLACGLASRPAELPGEYERIIELALARAEVADIESDPAAECYFEFAFDHLQTARQRFVQDSNLTRWDVRELSARVAFARHLEAHGDPARARDLERIAEATINRMMNTGFQIAPLSEEVAELYLAMTKRKHNDSIDPRPTVNRIESFLKSIWQNRNPSDRARETMALANCFAAEWAGNRNQHRIAIEYYRQSFEAINHGQPKDQNLELRRRSGLVLAFMAFHLANAGIHVDARETLRKSAEYDSNDPQTRYVRARTLAYLADSAFARPDDFSQAKSIIQGLDKDGVFHTSDYLIHYKSAAEFETMRQTYRPNTKKDS